MRATPGRVLAVIAVVGLLALGGAYLLWTHSDGSGPSDAVTSTQRSTLVADCRARSPEERDKACATYVESMVRASAKRGCHYPEIRRIIEIAMTGGTKAARDAAFQTVACIRATS